MGDDHFIRPDNDQAADHAQNTDVELWRHPERDWSVFVTDGNSIGMNKAGSVVVMPIEAWVDIVSAAVRNSIKPVAVDCDACKPNPIYLAPPIYERARRLGLDMRYYEMSAPCPTTVLGDSGT